jgi:serine acetyltransferase
VRTAACRLGRGVTVGVGANVEIGVEGGPGWQIGAMSAVPKFSVLDAHSTYVGAPARKLEARGAERPQTPAPEGDPAP